MRLLEIISEAQIDPDLEKTIQKKGYRLIGSGQDQDVYIAPDGSILKIFGYGEREDDADFSEGQQSFIDFAEFCMKRPNNPFLPKFSDLKQFKFKGNLYLQIKCERLFDFNGIEDIAAALEMFIHDISTSGAEKALEEFLTYHYDYEKDGGADAGKLITLLGGEKNIKVFAKTVEQLQNLAHGYGYKMDLHSANIMLSSDGDIVINDPFSVGDFRHY